MNTKNKFDIVWLAKMAWRDSRKNRGRLLLFTSSIVLGIAALVAINSFGDNLSANIEGEAKGLIGADFVLTNRQPVSDSVSQIMDSVLVDQGAEISFASMVQFSSTGGTRLVKVRALEGDFPFYGKIETNPATASDSFRKAKKAIVDNTLLMQFGASVGEMVKIGGVEFEIEGTIVKAPGEAGIAATVAPSVYIPMDYLEETGLIQKGSRITYQYYYKLPEKYDVETFAEAREDIFKKEGLRFDTVEKRKESVGRAFSNLTQFLNLVAFVALLLGCVGVASAVHIYIKEKLNTVAVLRCMGVQGIQAFLIFMIQIVVMGVLGSIVGALLGSVIQLALPAVLQSFLPFEVDFSISYSAIFSGILTGLLVSILFALPPSLKIRTVSPLRALRSSYEENGKTDWVRVTVYALIVLFILGFSFLQIGEIQDAFFFTLFLAIAFGILTGVALLLMWAVKKYFPMSWSYIWRQGVANLFRPNNQTVILIVSVGLGTALISTLFFVQGMLLDQINFAGSGGQPNMVLFDIQSPQKEEVKKLTESHGLPVISEVPIVTMRLETINGVTKAQNMADSTSKVKDWAFGREFRNTYRDSLIESETTLSGIWQSEIKSPDDSIFVSFEERFAKRMGVKMGDELVFDVQGTPVKTYIGHMREVDWNRVQTNFLVVFPKGVLEYAPQFHVLITKVNTDEASASFQQDVVSKFPNISIIDLNLILKTVDEVLGQVSFVIRFMALFSIVTGLLVLTGSVIISKFQRIQESVLLRTLGANRKQVLRINALEYLFLGGLAALSGILLALGGSWALAQFNFDAPFTPNIGVAALVFLCITLLTVGIGMLNSRGVLNKPPLEVLRSEV